jgi:hypothetical protein
VRDYRQEQELVSAQQVLLYVGNEPTAVTQFAVTVMPEAGGKTDMEWFLHASVYFELCKVDPVQVDVMHAALRMWCGSGWRQSI